MANRAARTAEECGEGREQKWRRTSGGRREEIDVKYCLLNDKYCLHVFGFVFGWMLNTNSGDVH